MGSENAPLTFAVRTRSRTGKRRFVLNCGTYQAFLEKMRNPAATDIVKAIKNFLNDFGASPPDAERDSERVQVRLRPSVRLCWPDER